MTLFNTVTAACLALCLIARGAHAEPAAVDGPARGQAIDALVVQLRDYYVFPELGEAIGAELRVRQRRGDYEELADAKVFAKKLTADLKEIGRDKHLRVTANGAPRPAAAKPAAPPAPLAGTLKLKKPGGFGIEAVEILPGNIGYVELSGFHRLAGAGPAITKAMTELADSDALIVDLRNNGGGDPAGVAFLSSYLFDQRTHLNDLYWREGNRTQEFWTDSEVPGKRYGQRKPVYVLTGPGTFSGGEEFSYNLQQLKRGTLVGETTGGGANPGRVRELTPQFSAFIPNGRAINPITKTNWEGVGVKPDVAMPAANALLAAHALALEKLAVTDPQRAVQLREQMAELTRRVD